jgi:pimeloyl-ACP methyl ester carboxylesterase
MKNHVTDARSERFSAPVLDGVTLHSLHWGLCGAPTLVLLHGGGANAHWWDHIAPRLANDFHAVALDFRGHGDSDYPEHLEADAFGRDLDALLTHLKAPDAILMGHSMGAHVAVGRAACGPGPRAVVALEISRGGRRNERRRSRLALAARRTYRTREEAVRRFQFLPATPGADEALRAAIAEHSLREEPDGRFGYRFDPRWFGPGRGTPPVLERIACPTLVIRGEQSTLLSAEGAAQLVAKIPQATLVEIPGGGHNVHLEQPDAVVQATRAFLARFRGPKPG